MGLANASPYLVQTAFIVLAAAHPQHLVAGQFCPKTRGVQVTGRAADQREENGVQRVLHNTKTSDVFSLWKHDRRGASLGISLSAAL